METPHRLGRNQHDPQKGHPPKDIEAQRGHQGPGDEAQQGGVGPEGGNGKPSETPEQPERTEPELMNEVPEREIE